MPTNLTQKFTERMRGFDSRLNDFSKFPITEPELKSFVRDTVIAVLEAEREREVNTPASSDKQVLTMIGFNAAKSETIAALDLSIKEIKEI